MLRKKIIAEVNHPAYYDKPLTGLKIVVDAGNGAGGFYAEKVLKPLGADTTGSRYLEPDGSFPNHIPNPENKEAMESITNAVKNNNADLGIIFDTDVDRAGAVLSDGSELNRNRIIAMLAAKCALLLLKLLKRTASYTPGYVALKIFPDFLGSLKMPKTVICVTGTNGKTTVSNLLTDALLSLGKSIDFD